MSKNLRVFLLSVLVVVLGVSSAFAALPTYTILPQDGGNYHGTPVAADGFYDVVDADGNYKSTAAVGGYSATGTNTLVINANGKFTFDDTFFTDAGTTAAFPEGPIIDKIELDPNDAARVTDAEFVIPTPYPKDAPSEGTSGNWVIQWPKRIANSLGVPVQVSNTNRVKFTISKRSTNSAILAQRVVGGAPTPINLFTFIDPRVDTTVGYYDEDQDTNPDTVQQVREGWDFVLNAPIRVNQLTDNALQVITTVRDGGTFTFDREAEIFADKTIPNNPTGYARPAAGYFFNPAPGTGLISTYDVNPGGELIIRNTWALRGKNLTVNVWPGVGEKNNGKRARLTFDLPKDTTHDLRGVGNANFSTALETDGADLIADGDINVLEDMTLWGEIITRGQYQPTNGYVQDPNPFAPIVGGTNGTKLYPYQLLNSPWGDTPNAYYNADNAGPGNGAINPLRQTIFKTGKGKLTLADSSGFEVTDPTTEPTKPSTFRGSISHQVRFINVLEGALEFKTSDSLTSNYRTWWAGGWLGFDFTNGLPAPVTPIVTVSEGAEFIAHTNSIVDDNAGRGPDKAAKVNSVAFTVNGTARFYHHAIFKPSEEGAPASKIFNEIFPYENFVTFNNGLLINARDISLTISEKGKVIIDNGAFAAGKIAGKGAIEILNDKDPSRDRAVLILTDPFGADNAASIPYRAAPNPNNLHLALANENYARSYIDFEGSIKGGSLGLYTPFATDIAYSRRIFQRMKSVDLENLIVYGPAQLNVDANTKLNGVKNIWLRGHRPGAANYNANGTVNNAIAYSKLTVGKLNFTPGARNTEVTINSLKVDGSSSYEDMGAVRVLYTDNDTSNAGIATAVPALTAVQGRLRAPDIAVAAQVNPNAGRYPRDYSAVAPYNGVIAPFDINLDGRLNNADAINVPYGINRDTRAIGPRLNAYIKHIELYANSGEKRDFPKAGYANPSKGIYALRLDSAAQPSRIIIDGTKVEGDGLEADFNDKFYQFEVTGKSDVRFTGADGAEYPPFAKNNSMRVRQDAKLAIDRGAIVNGHLAFEPSTANSPERTVVPNVWPTFGRHWVLRNILNNVEIWWPRGIDEYRSDMGEYPINFRYPADEDFVADEGWYDGLYGLGNGFAFTNTGRINGPRINSTLHVMLAGFLYNYTAFTTQIGERNRRTNDGGEYAVQVKGNLTLATDDLRGYSGGGRVLVRAEPDLTVYEADPEESFTTIGERFKVIGEANEGNYTADFATSFNRFFLFHITTPTSDKKGVTVGNREELAVLTMNEGSFMKGGEDFGMGDGHNFSYKIPFTLTYRGEKITLQRTVDASNNIHYYVGLGGEKYEVELLPSFFNYYEGMSSSNENVSDISALTTLASNIEELRNNSVYVSKDIDVRAEFDTVLDASGKIQEQFVRVIGTSYSGEAPVNLRLGLFCLKVVGTGSDWLDGVVPGYKQYTLLRKGVTPPDQGDTWSTAVTKADDSTEITVGNVGDVSFTVSGLRKATFSSSSVPVLENGNYVWNAAADNGTYYLLDANGRETKVTNLVVLRFDGDYLKKDTVKTVISDGFTITPNDNVATVKLPIDKMGNTGGKFSAVKGLALRATRADGNGDIITVPVNYTLHSAIPASDTKSLTPQTVTIGGDSISLRNDIDDLGDNLHFIPYGLPSWLGYTEYDGGFGYNTGNLTGVKPGTYNFSVLAYSGDNAESSPHRLYTFTVNVQDAEKPGISGENEVTVNLPDGTKTVTLTLVGGATGNFAVAANTNPASLLSVTTAGVVTVKAAGVAAGDYKYTITAGTLQHAMTVHVVAPELEIEEVYNGFDNSPLNNYTYYATYKANGATGDVTWTLTDNTKGKVLHSAKSGDLFVVEGTVKAMPEDAEDTDQTFVVKAVSGTQKAEQEVTFSVDPDEQTYTSLAATSGTHDAVAAGYKVDFPAGVKADSDNVFLPSWLKPVLNDDDEVVGIAFAGPVGDFAKGTKATVRILATNDNNDDVYYGWDVVYGVEGPAPAKLALKATPATLDLAPSATGTVTLEATDAQGDVTYTADKTWAVISGTTATITAPATEGTYEVTFTATDSRGEAGKAEAKVTVKVTKDAPVGKLTLTTDKEVNLYFGTETGPTSTITLTTANALGTVTYDYSVTPATGLTVAISGNKATLTGTESGEYTVTFKATDAGRTTDNTATFTTKVTVSGGALPEKFSLSVTSKYANGVTFDISRGTISLNIADVVNPVNNQGTVSYTATSSSDGLKVVVSGNTATVTATKTGKYTVTIKGTDAGRTTDNTATATISVTVTGGDVGSSSGGGGCDAGFGALALALAAPLFLRRRRS